MEMIVEKKPLFLKHDKRFVVIFNYYNSFCLKSKSITEYDSLEEAKEECDMIEDVYKDVTDENLPKNWQMRWSYFLLDFQKEKIVRWKGDLYGQYFNTNAPNRRYDILDFFFRKEDEIPVDYKWVSQDEYKGWLLYRWNRPEYNRKFGNNGKPARKTYGKHQKEENKSVSYDKYEEIEDKFDALTDYENLKSKEFKW